MSYRSLVAMSYQSWRSAVESSVESSVESNTSFSPTTLLAGGVVGHRWFSTHTYGTKRKPSYHLARWSTHPESSYILVAPDVRSYLDQWETGMRVQRSYQHP